MTNEPDKITVQVTHRITETTDPPPTKCAVTLDLQQWVRNGGVAFAILAPIAMSFPTITRGEFMLLLGACFALANMAKTFTKNAEGDDQPRQPA